MHALSIWLALVGIAAASKPGLKFGNQKIQGVATFNNYQRQGNTVCGPLSGKSGTYGAAASDISPQISGGACRGEIDMSVCSGQQPKSSYIPPQCPRSNCGLCYEVTNKGGYGSSHIGGVGNKITVQIIDSCPQTNAWNFCKTEVSKDQRCSDNSTNQLDIDESAYEALTGEAFGHGPNLDVEITPVHCP